MIQPSLALRGFTPEEKEANADGVGSLGYLYQGDSREALPFRICNAPEHGCGFRCEFCGSDGSNAVFLVIMLAHGLYTTICLDCLDEDDKTDLVWTLTDRSRPIGDIVREKRTAVNPETGEEIATAWDEDGQPQ